MVDENTNQSGTPQTQAPPAPAVQAPAPRTRAPQVQAAPAPQTQAPPAKPRAPRPLLEIRLSLLGKEPITNKEGVVIGEKHVSHTSFEITDQDLCYDIADLLGDAVDEQTDPADHPKDEKTGEVNLDAHKFELDGRTAAEKKAAKAEADAKKSA